MEITREIIKGEEVRVPTIVVTPAKLYGAAVVIHGYGGSKEEQLGLAYRIAELGFKTYAIDLRGHGENTLSLDEKVVLDAEAVVKECSKFGKVAAVGHSLGGRLALTSSADYAIGISPALGKSFGEETQKRLKSMRGYRVKENKFITEMIGKLPDFEDKGDGKRSIIYGERDIPEIANLCKTLKSESLSVVEIENAMHSDIFSLESTIQSVVKQLKCWL